MTGTTIAIIRAGAGVHVAAPRRGCIALASVGRPATTSGYPVPVTQRVERTFPAAKC
jgi:hypothetical protein